MRVEVQVDAVGTETLHVHVDFDEYSLDSDLSPIQEAGLELARDAELLVDDPREHGGRIIVHQVGGISGREVSK